MSPTCIVMSGWKVREKNELLRWNNFCGCEKCKCKGLCNHRSGTICSEHYGSTQSPSWLHVGSHWGSTRKNDLPFMSKRFMCVPAAAVTSWCWFPYSLAPSAEEEEKCIKDFPPLSLKSHLFLQAKLCCHLYSFFCCYDDVVMLRFICFCFCFTCCRCCSGVETNVPQLIV